ncbi:hypothetical protein HNR06_000988 [Nocardiopsis arvandica]|uniref:Uncharacterized protein n=1 Tax=Nocardiopsis sinuspersici TaxID=501010 RepID=A0A7Y9X919_9ACTN|nr:hypothetical protein [Nocardiopsis sinuspersici]NYH51399.1 hypothetical protein [Nocardiopsis sinuspersici]
MGGLLTVLGNKLAEQWLTLLALPGALYAAAAVGARTLGHHHTWDLDHLIDQITAWARDPRIDTVAGQVVVSSRPYPSDHRCRFVARDAGRCHASTELRSIIGAHINSWRRPMAPREVLVPGGCLVLAGY